MHQILSIFMWPLRPGIKKEYSLSFLFFSLLAIVSPVTAQIKIWDKTIGGDGYESKPSIYPTPDGGYILGCSSSSDKSKDKSESSGVDDFWIIKLNATGSIVWENTINVRDWDQFITVLPTPDGGYIAGGYTAAKANGDKTAPRKGKNDYWLVKLKADGTKTWDKTFGGTGNDLLRSMQVTADGGYILAGYSDSGISGDKSDPHKGSWVIKLKADGTKEWDKTLVGGGVTSNGLTHDQIQQTNDGGYILGTTSNYGKVGDKTESSRGGQDYWLVKLNGDGRKAWDKSYGGTKGDYLASVVPTSDGGYLLAGNSYSGIGGDKSEASRDVGNGDEFYTPIDFWVIKVDAQGKKVWDKTLGGNFYDAVSSAQQTQDGGYLLGGTSNSKISGEKTQKKVGNTDYWLVKLKADGSKDWDKVIGGTWEDELWVARQTNDKNYILVGESVSEISGDKTAKALGFYDLWVVKLDNNNIHKKEQTITFNPIVYKYFQSQKTFTLAATSSSGLPVSYRVQDGPATVNGNQVTLTGPGMVTIIASQAGDATYAPAREVQQTFEVSNAPVTQLWNKTYGGVVTLEVPGNNGLDCDASFGSSDLTSMLAAADGGYLLAGTSDSKKGNDKSQDHLGTATEGICFSDEQPITDYWVVKTDANGRKLWDKTFGTNQRDELVAFRTTPDGGYILGGTTSSPYIGAESYADHYLVKIDANGNKIWDKKISTKQYDIMSELIATPDGGYLISDGSSIIKLDGAGNVVWNKKFPIGLIRTVLATADGGYLLGSGYNSGGEDYDDRNYDYRLIKLDSNGNKLWDKTYGGSGNEDLQAIVTTPDGGYLLGGNSNSPKSGDKSESGQGDEEDYWIIKVDATGYKLWDKTYGGSTHDDFQAMVATPDGGYLLGGNSSSPKSGDKSESNRGKNTISDDDFWIIKINSKGQKMWDKTLGGNRHDDQFKALLADPDGSYVIGGSSSSPISGDKEDALKGYQDYWVIKIREKINPTTPMVARRTATLTDEPAAEFTTVTAYPNPFQEKVTVSFSLPKTQTATLRILDGQGREVATLFQEEAQAKQIYQLEWQAGQQEVGMYLLQLQTPTGQNTHKILLHK